MIIYVGLAIALVLIVGLTLLVSRRGNDAEGSQHQRQGVPIGSDRAHADAFESVTRGARMNPGGGNNLRND